MEYVALFFFSFILLSLYIFFWFKIEKDWEIDDGDIKGNEIEMFHKANRRLEELIEGDNDEENKSR